MNGFKLKLLAIGIIAGLCAQAAPAEAREFKVLTYNTWMLKILFYAVGEDMKLRGPLIPYAISALDADVIALQETWQTSVKKEWKRVLKSQGYKYTYYTRRGLGMGDGLLIASKHPILYRVKSKPYRDHPRFDEIFAQKRILGVTVYVDGYGPVQVYTSHLGAINYDRKKGVYKEPGLSRQGRQFDTLKTWLKNQINRLDPTIRRSVVFTADLNRDYHELDGGIFQETFDKGYLKLIKDTCGPDQDLINTYLFANRYTSKDPHAPTYSNQNRYVREGRFWMFPSEVEDYIFSCPSDRFVPRESSLVFNLDPILSDHYALMTTFDLR